MMGSRGGAVASELLGLLDLMRDPDKLAKELAEFYAAAKAAAEAEDKAQAGIDQLEQQRRDLVSATKAHEEAKSTSAAEIARERERLDALDDHLQKWNAQLADIERASVKRSDDLDQRLRAANAREKTLADMAAKLDQREIAIQKNERQLAAASDQLVAERSTLERLRADHDARWEKMKALIGG